MAAAAFLLSRSSLHTKIPLSFLLKPISSNCFSTIVSLKAPLLPIPAAAASTTRLISYTNLHSNPLQTRFYSSKSNTNSPVSFPSSSDSESDDDHEEVSEKKKNKTLTSKLPPPYDPFSKKPVIEEPKDPKNLQEIFHKMRTTDGLMNSAVKMFDALSKDGLTHEAMELFGIIKDKGNMPEVVAHTAVIEAYANAGHSKEALKVYMRMLAAGIKPNAYTYTVLIKGLAKDGKLGDAKKYILEMMNRGIWPNVGTYTTVFEAFAKEDKMEECKELLEQMKAKGFVVTAADEDKVGEHLTTKRGQVYRSIMDLLFAK
ncbi:hypothetical protein C5167_015019 [Papaver somniferum]|uniref:Pentacotripeptide-repeat region of PRORP domain-containing protein n=1 Tax=Papaver somniferum TaxID=3469 RepID=A0A4Y7J7Y9_PAPSO|nr:pentatricopeptide repeat-containing protein At4g38150-like [Papaver somniferum]RZC56170.1 hypothetical protein C5167_015019 [Papaver somniferum]